MSSQWGTKLKLSLFGESHGPAVGIVVDGLPAGLALDEEEIARQMRRRAPGWDEMSTPRQETDIPRILSGLFEGRTTGTPLCAVIENGNTRSGDYAAMIDKPRPGHADYPGFRRYGGYNDPRGGGHFSGRLTAPLVFAGTLARQLLAREGVVIGAHAAAIGGVEDVRFDPADVRPAMLDILARMPLPLLDPSAERPMRAAVAAARAEGDSVGGVIECAVIGLPVGVGDPFFDSMESTLSHLLFSIPAVKGVEFGDGFALAALRGSQANDPYRMQGGQVVTATNRNGGLLGGLTTGMPVIFRAAVKPTPSISRPQDTVSLTAYENATLTVTGRHDPCIVPRALPVVEAAAALAVYEHLPEKTR